MKTVIIILIALTRLINAKRIQILCIRFGNLTLAAPLPCCCRFGEVLYSGVVDFELRFHSVKRVKFVIKCGL